jgi:hypothetical protein
MFAAYCTTTDSAVLLSESSILGLHRTAEHIEVELECHCGERLVVRVDRSERQRALVAA